MTTCSRPDHSGHFYQDCLRFIHDRLQPRTYLEVGTETGESLALAKCSSIAIDPHFQITRNAVGRKPSLFLFQMTSDEFFRAHSPRDILGSPIELAFLDGMHLFECLVRDFANTERCCRPESVVVLHDCIPLDLHMAVRDVNDKTRRSLSRYPEWWTGDVWKLLPILWQYRPDLVISAFNAPPTGLIVISNLDPQSRVLDQHHTEIVSSFLALPDECTLFSECMARLEIRGTQELGKVATGVSTIVTDRLSELVKDGPTSIKWQSADLREVRLMAPAGTYTRTPPVFVDAEQATDATKQWLADTTCVLEQAHGALHCVTLRDATVVGQGSVITTDGVLLWESASEFLAHGWAPDGLRQIGNDRWQFSSEPVQRVQEPCLLVKRPWFRNFGHWLVDCATLLAMFADDVRRFGWTIVTGVYDDPAMDRIVKETLALLTPGAPVLVQPDHEVWQFADLRYAMPVHVPPQFKLPAAIRRLREMILKSQDFARDTTSLRGRRVYLSRQDTGARRIANEVDLVSILSQFGFETIYLNGRSLSDQALLFRHAEAILGVKGAALANIMFCEPSCPVMVLSPADFPDPFFWDIAAQLGLRFAELFGQVTTCSSPGLNDFIVDPAALVRMLDVVLDPGMPIEEAVAS